MEGENNSENESPKTSSCDLTTAKTEQKQLTHSSEQSVTVTCKKTASKKPIFSFVVENHPAITVNNSASQLKDSTSAHSTQTTSTPPTNTTTTSNLTSPQSTSNHLPLHTNTNIPLTTNLPTVAIGSLTLQQANLPLTPEANTKPMQSQSNNNTHQTKPTPPTKRCRCCC